MKKILLCIALFSAIPFYGQQHRVAENVQQLVAKHASFIQFSPLGAKEGDTKQLNNVAANATFATFRQDVVKQIVATQPQALELSIPYNGSTVTMQLYRTEVLAKGFHADTNKTGTFAYKPGTYYRGIVKGDNTSIASFSFFDNEMSGIVSSSTLNNLVVGRLQKQKNWSDYIIYSDVKLTIPNTFTCETAGRETLNRAARREPQAIQPGQTNNCVTVYYEIDHDLFLQNSSSQQLTGNWITSLFNNIQTLYDNDGIDISLKSFNVWTVPDPYFGTDSSDYLQQFYETHFFTGFDGDVGQLLGIDGSNMGGVAVLEGLCSDAQNVSYINLDDLVFNEVPLYSWSVHSISHELGHLLGSDHTHACVWNGNNTMIDSCGPIAGIIEGDCDFGPLPNDGGTIMSYCHLTFAGVNFANGFGPQPAERISNFINSSSCLGTACAATACHNSITALAVNTANTGTTVSWQDETTGPWEISYHEINTNGNWQQTITSAVTLEGLLPNTYYIVNVRPVCDGGVPTDKEILFATDADWCMGQPFTDAGGTNGRYENRQNFTRTFTPSAQNTAIRVNFSVFDIEDGFDFLEVYNGPDITAPLTGIFTGNNLPAEIISSATDGSLTFRFTSDDTGTARGWNATVDCNERLGTNANTLVNFLYYPNPAHTALTLKAGEQITRVSIYNVTGQLLQTKTVNAQQATIDISGFANGVYFFKATSKVNQSNFRIIKQ